MQATDLILELGNTLGIAVTLEEDTCQIIFDEEVVHFEVVDSALFVFAEIAPAHERADAYERLLEANFAGQQTGGATISLHDASFILHVSISDECTYASFEKALERFLKALRYWKEWLALPPAQDMGSEPFSPLENMLRI